MTALDRRSRALRARLGELERRLASVEARLVEMYSGQMQAEPPPAQAEVPRGGSRRIGLGEIAQIRAALARIAQGTYGSCTCCGRAIAGERLDRAPATPFCTHCAV